MKDPMRILFLIDALAYGGKERQVLELLKGLLHRGGIVCRLVVLSNSVDYRCARDLNAGTMFLERRWKKDPSVWMKLCAICRAFKPDIIHVWEIMCAVYGIPVARLFGAKILASIIRDATPKEKRTRKPKWLPPAIFRFSDLVISNSFAGLAAYEAPQGKSRCIHNGFDFGRVAVLKDPSEVRSTYGIATPKVVGMVAAFSPRKDYETYLTAATRLVGRREDVTFVAVGDGPMLDPCRNRVAPPHRRRILFLGKQQEVESIVNVFDVGVLLSNHEIHSEGIPNAVQEYMALARPVVATRGGGTDEIVEDGRTGYLIDPGDVSSLEQKIEFLLDNQEQAGRLGAAGRQKVVLEFSLETMTQQYLDAYAACLDRAYRKGHQGSPPLPGPLPSGDGASSQCPVPP
ncbi:MAG: glycosyltransferase [bacterium]